MKINERDISMDNETCEKCSGTGWVDSDTGLIVCDICNQDMPVVDSTPKSTRPVGRPKGTATPKNNSGKSSKPNPSIIELPKIGVDESVLSKFVENGTIGLITTWPTSLLHEQIALHKNAISALTFELFRRGDVSARRIASRCPACSEQLEDGICINSECIYGAAHL